ncbi:MAG: ice-binding family protein [Gemmatimonadales bacterium]
MRNPLTHRLLRAFTPPGLITRLTVAVACLGAVVAACDVHSAVGPGSLVSLTVSPNPTMVISSTQQFTAAGKDADNVAVSVVPVWSIVAGGGSISPAGMFTAGIVTGTFTATVKATSGTITGTATVIVTNGALATITVTPNPQTLGINATQQFTAVGKDAGNNVLPIIPVWSVVASGGAINSGSGLFTAGAVTGTFTNTVKATSGAISGTATVTVTAGPVATISVTPNPDTLLANATQQFTAVAKDASNNVVAIVPVWSVVASGGAISGSGLFTAGAAAGTFTNTVKATSGAIFGTATVVVTAAIVPPIANLGTAAPNGIMAGTAFTCISGGTINADIAISPGSTVTGFPPCVITGTQHLADAVALQGQTDLTAAYNTLAGLPCPPANAIVADLGGTTKPAGVYCTASSIGVTGPLTLDGGGDPNATFVFQAGTSLITAGDVILINGAQAKNVWWQVGSSATLGTASQFQGNILALTSITLVANANLNGRALARNGAVSLDTNNNITLP